MQICQNMSGNEQQIMEHTASEKRKNNAGFTLAELLIVVAIIGVLVGISIPIFNAQMEKARRAVDLHTARSVESVLANAYNMGRIQLTADKYSQAKGISAAVMICRDSSSIPAGYNTGWFQKNRNPACWCTADPGILVDGTPASTFGNYNEQVADILKESGLDPATLCTRSNGKDDGWDWIVIMVGVRSSTDRSICTRIYSGMKGQESGYIADNGSDALKNTTNNIEELIHGK